MTPSTTGIVTLSQLFSQPSLLPELPTDLYRLAGEISDKRSSTNLLTWILATEPDICTNFERLCQAHQIEPGRQGVDWIPTAILLLGSNAVRRFVIALLLQRTICVETPGCMFDPAESAILAEQYGLLAECVFAGPESFWGAEGYEVGAFFAGEVMHELLGALLAQQAPDVYNRVQIKAQTQGVPFASAFEQSFGHPLSELGLAACQAWGLPETFGRFLLAATDGLKLEAFAKAA